MILVLESCQDPVNVQIDDNVRMLQAGESIPIPKQIVHMLAGVATDAIILEISTGDFDEVDIVRLEDNCNRTA